MKKLLTTLSILLIATASYAQTYIVERVVDGDTLKLTNGEEVQLIGVNAPKDVFPEGADRTLLDPTTESVNEADDWGVDLDTLDKMGQEATEFVKGLLPEGSEVRLEYDVQDRDKYGRLLAYVFIPSCLPECPASFPGTHHFVKDMGKYWHIFLNATIIKSGYATPMTIPPNVKYADLFKELYEKARGEKRGLWKQKIFLSKESFIKKLTEGMTQDDVVTVLGQPEEYACGEGGFRPIIPEHPENECWIYRVKDGWFVDVYFSGKDKKYFSWSQSNTKYPMDLGGIRGDAGVNITEFYHNCPHNCLHSPLRLYVTIYQ